MRRSVSATLGSWLLILGSLSSTPLLAQEADCSVAIDDVEVDAGETLIRVPVRAVLTHGIIRISVRWEREDLLLLGLREGSSLRTWLRETGGFMSCDVERVTTSQFNGAHVNMRFSAPFDPEVHGDDYLVLAFRSRQERLNTQLELSESGQACHSARLSEAAVPTLVRGDVNLDLRCNLSDAVGILDHLFTGGEGLVCEQAGDANTDGKLDLSDALYLLNALYRSGPQLSEACEPATGTGRLECAETSACAL